MSEYAVVSKSTLKLKGEFFHFTSDIFYNLHTIDF